MSRRFSVLPQFSRSDETGSDKEERRDFILPDASAKPASRTNSVRGRHTRRRPTAEERETAQATPSGDTPRRRRKQKQRSEEISAASVHAELSKAAEQTGSLKDQGNELAPDQIASLSSDSSKDNSRRTLLIACGALAREVVALKKLHNWENFDVSCLPAIWHNRPEKIPFGVQERINEARADNYGTIKVLYGDCGTGGELDQVLAREGVERLDGDHCYAFFTGLEAFADLHEQELGSFFLTDYLARHFETLIMKGMGLEEHPELMPLYFGHYKKLVYLAQTENPQLQELAEKAAERLGLSYEYRYTGYGELESFMPRISEQ
ncbi:DUF1638 domain-containing protein [Kiloniella sp. b19]|uniref:DUF1638 domain-containing protein n=1 Tax=Kiloniella sp. GXU_MW_B19 TaxID=3141326 RepID=UPI0031E4385F